MMLPKATHQGILKIGEVEINCFVLEDGRRLLSGRAVTSSVGLTGRGQGMARFLDSKSLNPLISNELSVAIKSPIVFSVVKGIKPIFGYEAKILPELCNIIIDANDQRPLPSQQQPMVKRAKLLQRAFSTVGITALVDEATGYQEVRDRKALHEILELYIAKELLPWTRRFPPAFYMELFRLRGWQWRGMSINRPSYVGTLTNDLVYSRITEGLLRQLKARSPKNEKGYRKNKLHQWLTPDVGHPELAKHLAALIALMKASSTWNGFKRAVERALPPREGSQQELHVEDLA